MNGRTPEGRPPADPPAGGDGPRRGGGFPLADLIQGAPLIKAVLGVSAVVLALMAVTGCVCAETAVDYGALLVNDGQVDGWWRVVTSGFVHFGIGHLAMNAFGLVVFGGDLERRYGSARLGILFLASVAGGSLLTIAMERSVVAGGASGGVFGFMGAWIAVMIVRRRRGQESVPATGMIIYVVIALALGASQPGIGNAAHAGGLAAGFVTALALERSAREELA